MRRAVQSKLRDEFKFEDIEQDDLYYRDEARAIVEIPLGGSDLERICFVHRGHPSPFVPQYEWWTVSDIETGLAIGMGQTAESAIEEATR